jgi:hypothetical protein
MHDRALQTSTLDGDRARLAALDARVSELERELTRLKHDLLALQSRYLDEIGGLYAKLNEIETAIADAEVALGLRPPADPAEADPDGEATAEAKPEEAESLAAGCGNRAAPTADLKRIFRQLAKTIHPDLALDGPARYRRHSLMAEANRAYAERDEDRLRLILSRWELGHDIDAHDQPVPRRIAALEERRLAMEAELADLRTSAIWRLHRKIEDARQQGWDLFAEMIREVEREIRRGEAKLARLERRRP